MQEKSLTIINKYLNTFEKYKLKNDTKLKWMSLTAWMFIYICSS